MKKSVNLASVVATALLAASATSGALAQTAQSPKAAPGKGYVQSPNGNIVIDPFGLCWRTGYWTPTDAQKGCDEDLLPKAPPPPPPPPARPVPPPAAAPAAPTSQKVTFAADAFFDFDKAVLKPEGKARLNDLVSKLQGVTLEVIIATGHTDSIGSVAYNQKLSVRRAEAVKAYLVSKGIEANRIYTEGKGKSQPIASNKTAAGRAKNRRVEIEVVGTQPTR